MTLCVVNKNPMKPLCLLNQTMETAYMWVVPAGETLNHLVYRLSFFCLLLSNPFLFSTTGSLSWAASPRDLSHWCSAVDSFPQSAEKLSAMVRPVPTLRVTPQKHRPQTGINSAQSVFIVSSHLDKTNNCQTYLISFSARIPAEIYHRCAAAVSCTNETQRADLSVLL